MVLFVEGVNWAWQRTCQDSTKTQRQSARSILWNRKSWPLWQRTEKQTKDKKTRTSTTSKKKQKTKNNLITDNSHNNNTKARHLEFFFHFIFFLAGIVLPQLLWENCSGHSQTNTQPQIDKDVECHHFNGSRTFFTFYTSNSKL